MIKVSAVELYKTNLCRVVPSSQFPLVASYRAEGLHVGTYDPGLLCTISIVAVGELKRWLLGSLDIVGAGVEYVD